MAQRPSAATPKTSAPPQDSLIFLGAVVPLICAALLGALPVTAGAALVLGWCLLLGAQGVYAGLVFNTGMPPSSSPGHLAAVLEAGYDDDYLARRLRMLGGGLTPANSLVMAAAAATGFVAFGPLCALTGAALIYALAVHSYTRAVRYTIWSVSTLVLIHGCQVALSAEAGSLAIAGLSTNIAGTQMTGFILSGLITVLGYRFTIIVNLRHIAGLAFAHAGISAALLAATLEPAVTNLVTLAGLLFAPGLCATACKARRHCRHRLYGYSG